MVGNGYKLKTDECCSKNLLSVPNNLKPECKNKYRNIVKINNYLVIANNSQNNLLTKL